MTLDILYIMGRNKLSMEEKTRALTMVKEGASNARVNTCWLINVRLFLCLLYGGLWERLLCSGRC